MGSVAQRAGALLHARFGSRRSLWPVIVGGVHRSGTSMVRRILNAHAHIYCGPEVKFFNDFHGDYVNDPVQHARFIESARAMLPDDELLAILGKAFVEMHERAARADGKRRWADKCPENVLHLAEWERILGERWLFVQVVRNPLDTLTSIAEANFRFAIPSGLQERIAFYRQYSEAGLAWGRANPERSYRIVYERLVSAPEEQIGRLMRWLGERSEPSQLDFNAVRHQAGLEDPKVGSTKRVHADSVGRWRSALSAADAALILEGTAQLWKDLDVEGCHPLDAVAPGA